MIRRKNIIRRSRLDTRLAQHRRNAAALAREIRAMWSTLKGDWTRIEWNDRAREAAHQHVSNMISCDRRNA